MAILNAKILTVTSVKGGTGKTNVALNLASVLSDKKHKTLIVDLDLYESAVAPLLNLNNENNIYTLSSDILNGYTKELTDYVVKYNDYIDCLLAPNDPRRSGSVSASSIQRIIAKVKNNYEYIIVDTNYFMNDINLSVMDMSDLILYVIDADLVSLKGMRTITSIYKDLDKKNFKILMNNSLNKYRSKFNNYDVTNIVNIKIDYVIPSNFYQKNMAKYIENGQILLGVKGIKKSNARTYKVFEEIIKDLDKEVLVIEKIN